MTTVEIPANTRPPSSAESKKSPTVAPMRNPVTTRISNRTATSRIELTRVAGDLLAGTSGSGRAVAQPHGRGADDRGQAHDREAGRGRDLAHAGAHPRSPSRAPRRRRRARRRRSAARTARARSGPPPRLQALEPRYDRRRQAATIATTNATIASPDEARRIELRIIAAALARERRRRQPSPKMLRELERRRSSRAGRSGSPPGGLSGRQRRNVVPWRNRSPCRWS